jgi:hypothetical protein
MGQMGLLVSRIGYGAMELAGAPRRALSMSATRSDFSID